MDTVGAVLTCTHNQCFEKKYRKNNKKISSEKYLFTAVKICSLLHGRVNVMHRANQFIEGKLCSCISGVQITNLDPLKIGLREQGRLNLTPGYIGLPSKRELLRSCI